MEKDMNKTAENRRNAVESALNGGIEYSAFENMDRLAAIFAMQKLLNDDIAARRGLDFSVEEWEQRLVLAMISELSEVLDEVNFKWWKNKRPVNTEALQDELVDVLHFFVSMCLRAGMSAEDLYRKYCEKNKENFDRQYGKSTKTGYDPADSVQ